MSHVSRHKLKCSNCNNGFNRLRWIKGKYLCYGCWVKENHMIGGCMMYRNGQETIMQQLESGKLKQFTFALYLTPKQIKVFKKRVRRLFPKKNKAYGQYLRMLVFEDLYDYKNSLLVNDKIVVRKP